jgi:hypothetical protein
MLAGQGFCLPGILSHIFPYKYPHINPHTWGRHLPILIDIFGEDKDECNE